MRRTRIPEGVCRLWSDQSGQDVAEYGIMAAVILILAIGVVELIGTHAKDVFAQVGAALSSHPGD
jgi:Flp pilus assembly pilin Flp